MKSTKISEMSDEVLLKSEKTLKSLTYALAIVLGILFIILIVLTFKKGFTATSVVPIALFPIVIINLNSLREMKQEIEFRKLR